MVAVTVGFATITTVPLAVAVQLPELVTVTVYVPAVVVVILAVCAPLLHTYTTPLFAVSVAIAPLHIVSLATVGVGKGLTVAIPLAVAEHPEEFVAVTLKTPGVVVVMLEVVAPVLQTYEPPTPAPLATSVSIPPAHVAGLVTAALGFETVTVPLALAVHPDPLVTVTLYIVLEAGLTVMLTVVAPVLHT